MPVYAAKTLVTTTVSGTAVSTASSWIPMNIHETPFNVGFGVVVDGNGDVTYRVEHTFDDVFDPSVTPTAFVHDDVTAATASVDGNYAFPVRAVRLAFVSASGTSASATLTVIQAGV